MVYVALLRGINVGGNNKIEMSRLKAVFERIGLESVSTYINTGNVIFRDSSRSPRAIVEAVENEIKKEFGFEIKVLLRDLNNINLVCSSLPEEWVNNSEMKCDVMFLWAEADSPGIINQLTIKPDVDEVRYFPGAVIWRVDRENINKSGMSKLVGSKPYRQMTIRNCNTVRKLQALMQAVEAETL